MPRYCIQIVEHDGEVHYVEHEPSGQMVLYPSTGRAERDAQFWRDGLGDEVQSVNVVRFVPGTRCFHIDSRSQRRSER